MTETARTVARDVLLAVARDDAYANLLLPKRIADAGLDHADAGLATELTYGTLRWMGQYDAVIAHVAKRPVAEIDDELLQILRLGTHQLARMRTPRHAAVHESIELLGRSAKGQRGLANAVLRRIADAGVSDLVDELASGMADDEALALMHAHPVWVVRALRRTLDAEGAVDELEQLLAADNVAPRVQLVALPGLSTPDELGGESTASPIGRVAAAGDPAGIPAVADGRARVQDSGSQLAALAMSRSRPVRRGELWLDMCAGPGGKAALLAAEAAALGATLVANEVLPKRARLVERAVAAVTPAPTVVVGDGRRFGTDASRGGDTYDRILLDAPCTGLGALRRRPEARWRKQPADVPQLAELQQQLLESAIDALSPGGLLAYVTCSPHLAETRAVVQRGIRGRNVHLVDTRAALADIAPGIDLGESGDAVQLWPHRNGTDAMFIQLIERPAADAGAATAASETR